MAEGGGLLNRYTGKTVSGVRIPLSPPFSHKTPDFIGRNARLPFLNGRNKVGTGVRNCPISEVFWANIWANFFPVSAGFRPDPNRMIYRLRGGAAFFPDTLGK